MEDKVKVVIELPFRARFHWTESNWRHLKEMVGYDQLRVDVTNMLYSWLTKSEFSKRVVGSFDETWKILSKEGVFANQNIVGEYDVAWWALNSITFSGLSKNSLALNDPLKQALIDALTIPGTRGVQGTPSYKDRTKPELGFIADEWLTRNVDVPYQPDGNYTNALRNIFGDTIFWYEKQY